MKVLLRSCFMGNVNEPKDLLAENYYILRQSGLEFDNTDDQVIWKYIQDFIRAHNHVPDVLTLRNHFDQMREPEAGQRLAMIQSIQPLTKGDFITRVTDLAEDRRTRLVGELLREAAEITKTGREFREGRNVCYLKGPAAAIKHIVDQSHSIVAPTLGAKLSGEVTRDGADFKAEYAKIEEDPRAGVGQHTGLFQMDTAINGAKKYELWIHAAFTGGMKCVAGDTLIFDLRKGRLRSAQELSLSGDAPLVPCLDEQDWKIVPAQASPVVPSGTRSILRVATRTGHSIRVSGNHPFLTPNGWKNAEELRKDDWVALPKKPPGSDAVQYTKDTDLVPISLLESIPDGLRIPSRTGGWQYARQVKKRASLMRHGAKKFAQAAGDACLQKKLQGDVVWDRLSSILSDGVEMTYDLSVPGYANFVANGFITHNSTFMLNWAYNQAVWYKWNSLVFSLEMPYQQCRRLLYALHSAHPKFAKIRYQLGLQKDEKATVGLPYTHVRDATLQHYHPNAKQFLWEYVVPDFNGQTVVTGTDPETGESWGCEYGRIHIEVADPEKSDFTMADLRQKAELLYSQDPFHLVFVDHAGLMSPRKWVSNTTDRLNEIIRDMKRMAMSFNKGQGIPLVALFQINRDGYRAAMKAKTKGGIARYDLTHLSYSNECERSADIVTASWMDDDLSKANRVQFQCLKSRDQKPFDIFNARVEWPCRRLLTSSDPVMSTAQTEAVGNQIDQIKKLD